MPSTSNPPNPLRDVNIVGTNGVALSGTGIPVTTGLNATATLTGARVNNAAASGDVTIVAATAAQTTKVYRLKISVAGATVLQIKNGAGAILDVFNFAGNGGGFVLDLSAEPWYVTSANTALIINSSAAVQVDGRVEYLTS